MAAAAQRSTASPARQPTHAAPLGSPRGCGTPGLQAFAQPVEVDTQIALAVLRTRLRPQQGGQLFARHPVAAQAPQRQHIAGGSVTQIHLQLTAWQLGLAQQPQHSQRCAVGVTRRPPKRGAVAAHAVTLRRRHAGMLGRMSRRQQTRPLGSYLLRVQEEHIHRVVLRHELLDLAAGTVLRFASMAALQRHLRAAGKAAARPRNA